MTDNESLIDVAYLKECLETDAGGELKWKERPAAHFQAAWQHALWNRKFAGAQAGTAHKKQYITLCLGRTPDGRELRLHAHRVIWALVHGKWPDQHIDHINRDRSDNRPENLRDVAPDVNARNNGNSRGTGLIGAYRRHNGFIAQIKGRYLGSFATPEEASAAFHRAKADEQKLSPVSCTQAS